MSVEEVHNGRPRFDSQIRQTGRSNKTQVECFVDNPDNIRILHQCLKTLPTSEAIVRLATGLVQMYSQVFVATELFSALWDLVLLGSLRTSETVEFPFDSQLLAYTERIAHSWTEVQGEIAGFCGFSKDVMRIADESSPWEPLTSETAEYCRTRLAGELFLASGASEWPVFTDPVKLGRTLDRATKSRLTAAFDSAISGRYCFAENRREAGPLKSLRMSVRAASELAAVASPELNASKEVVEMVYEWWKAEKHAADLAAGLLHEEYKTWLIGFFIPAFEQR